MEQHFGLILMPAYNEWDNCIQLIATLDNVLKTESSQKYEVLIIDDGSTITEPNTFHQMDLQNIEAISILRLQRNIGHQRAICVGLAYIQNNCPCTSIILLDSDGEDNPADVPRLLERFQNEDQKKIIFAQRTKRSETWEFRFFLGVYKVVHRLLTGRDISIGNFSVIPYHILSSIVIIPELWIHYAASVLHARLPHVLVSSRREKRLKGKSKMSFTDLVMHGLSAISVYSGIVSTRLLIASCAMIFVVFLSLVSVISIGLFTELSLPLWATYSSGLLVMLFLQIVMFSMIFSVLTLNGRKHLGFVPLRDYSFFIKHYKTIWKRT